MGPQLDSCGRPWQCRQVGHEQRLQWGRNLTVAEGGGARGSEGIASQASMGPQLDSCGRRYIDGEISALIKLQWGRNLTVAEGVGYRQMLLYGIRLQWGRNLTVAEGDRQRQAHGGRLSRFNGAAT